MSTCGVGVVSCLSGKHNINKKCWRVQLISTQNKNLLEIERVNRMNSKYKTQSGYAKRTASTNTIKAMENGTNPNDFFYRF